MRSSIRLALRVFFAVALPACGGSSPPAQTGGATKPPVEPANEAAPAVSESAPSSELLAGIKAFDSGNFESARRSFEAAAKKNPRDYEALYNLGMACERLGDKSSAEAAYKAALEVKPDLESAAAELCALYVDGGRIDAALTVGKAALALHPRSAALHENVGVALATHGDQENAVHELEEASQAQPSEPMFHLTLAHWLNTWHVRGASQHLDAARGLVKDDVGMLAAIGHEYRMAGEFDSCVKTFDRAVALKDGGEVRTERALCKLGLKDEKATLDDLQAAVAKESSYAPAHYYLGGRLALAKRFKEAATEYAKYLEIAPSGSLAKPASERLKAAQEAAKSAVGAKRK